MVHRDDVAAAIRIVSESRSAGRIYNVVDDEPVAQGDFVTWLAREYGLPLPPVATEEENAARKRGLTHKRVRNARLRSETSWQPAYPTFREGYRRGEKVEV
jgi:nucleoside-diphosphate-sugar epimerase